MARSATAIVFVLLACAAERRETVVRFTPFSAATVNELPVVDQVTVAYRGDIAALKAAHARCLGWFEVTGEDENEVRQRAVREATRLGGTHILVDRQGTRSHTEKLTSDRLVTTSYGNVTTTVLQPGWSETTTHGQGAYTVLRVEPSQWDNLELGLRPTARVDLFYPPGVTPSRLRD